MLIIKIQLRGGEHQMTSVCQVCSYLYECWNVDEFQKLCEAKKCTLFVLQ